MPQVLAHDAALGLTLLEDLGDTLLASKLTDEASARAWYNRAIDTLVEIQSKLSSTGLPDFDAHFFCGVSSKSAASGIWASIWALSCKALPWRRGSAVAR